MIRVGAVPRSSFSWAAAGLFALVSATHLAAELTGTSGTSGTSGTARVSQWLLMPVLALCVVVTVGSRGRLVRLTLLALGFSWLGDAAPGLVPSGVSFLVMVGFFLGAQLAYIAAFTPFRGRSVLRPGRVVVTPGAIPYVVALVALVGACAPGTGVLLVPTVLYGACLATMAALATGVNRWVAAGGAIFLVSDSLIALHAFTSWYTLPQHGFWVMLTYIVGQSAITIGVVGHSRAGRYDRNDPQSRVAGALPAPPAPPVAPAT